MISYSYISDLFTAVLQQSATIQGRFFLSARHGAEINSDVLGQVLTDAVTQVQNQKYPLALMMAPSSRGELSIASPWQDYTITMFFLRPTYYDAFNQVADVNSNTQTSMRPVMKDWEEMGFCAINFIRALDAVQRNGNINSYFRLKKETRAIFPVSFIGADRVSGVRLDFAISLFVGCEAEDIDLAAVLSSMPVIEP